MNGRVLIVLPILLCASPAQADFFKDLGSALGQIGDAVDDAFTSDKPAQPAPAPPQQDIIWNAPPPDLSESSKAEPFRSTTPPSLRGRETAAFAPRSLKDDAPPPRRAPSRGDVMSSYLAPLPGFSESAPRPQATYSPVEAAAALPVATMMAPPSVLPGTKPFVASRSFAIVYGDNSLEADDDMVARKSKPGPKGRDLLADIGSQLKGSTTWRLRLQAEALAPEGQKAAARHRAFERALLVKQWLVDAGLRPTQIDMEIIGSGQRDAITLQAYEVR